MSKVITQTGKVEEEVTVKLAQGGGVYYSITFNPGTEITLVVVSHEQPKVRYVQQPAPKEDIPF
jgi:hypothetical protein